MFIKDMLNEELQNSLRARKAYKRAVARLPRGALVRKVIRGRPYYYLAFRDGRRVRFVYKGKMSKDEIARYEEAKKYRKKYRHQMSEINKQIRFLRKVLRGRDAV